MKNEIIADYVGIERYRQMNYAVACEDCAHFQDQKEICTFGFPTAPHLKRNQMARVEKDGFISFCRAIEID